ncbi:MAG: alpha/beta hydrolase [Planctomycetota bacterium]|jgi:predicted esterase
MNRSIIFIIIIMISALAASFPGCGSNGGSRSAIPPATGTTGNGGTGNTGTGSTGTGTTASSGTGGGIGIQVISNGYSYAPSSYNGAPMPLIILFHGAGGTADYFISGYKWQPTADLHGYLLCSLQSQSTYWGGVDSTDWNNALAMIEYMKANYNVREDKIVSFGFSNGAHFSCKMGIYNPGDQFDAFIACSNGSTSGYQDARKIPAYFMWGAGESTEPGKMAAEQLQAADWDITTRVHASGHTVPQNEIPTMADWLDSRIP